MERRTITPAELISLAAVAALALFAVSAGVLGAVPDEDVIDRVYVLLQWTRLEAVSRGTACSLELDPATAVARVVESGRGSVLHATDPLPEFRLFPTASGPIAGGRSRIEVRFDAAGRPAAGPAGFLVRSQRENGALWIDADGTIRAQSLDADTAGPSRATHVPAAS